MAKRVTPRPKIPVRRNFIRQWREYRELTQEQMAERMTEWLQRHGVRDGYSYATLGRLERGLIPYSQDVLEAAADALQTTPASLIMRDPSQDDDGEAMWSLWDHAKPGERQMILDIVRTITKTGT